MDRTKSVCVLKEIRPGERRAILLPEQVRQFKAAGFRVLVERDAGLDIGYTNAKYEAAGAEVVGTQEAWTTSDFVIKYKVPYPSEYKYFRKGMHLGALFHAENRPGLVAALLDSGITAYSYEFFRTLDGDFPMSVASSEIAGKLAIFYGVYHLQSHLGGSGVLLADVVGVKRPKVVIIGHGNAGGAAARLAIDLGNDVVVLGNNPEHLRRFQATVPSTVRCYINSREVLERELPSADLVVGALRISTYDTPAMIDETLVKKMKRGAMMVDVTCGYGSGYMPTFDHIGTFEQPVYERYGVLHCKLDTMPGSVPLTTNHAVSSLMAPYLIALGNSIFDEQAFDPTSAAGKIVERGRIVHPEVIRHMELLDAMDSA